MKRVWLGCGFGIIMTALCVTGALTQQDNVATEKTKDGNLLIHPINHATVRFEFKGKQYYCDPSGRAEWERLPKADYIFITHEHGDHLNPTVVNILKKDTVMVFMNASSVNKAGFGMVINHDEKKPVGDITVEAIPAYNTTEGRLMFHPKERKDNGYVMTFGDKRVYVAGDTEDIPEMRALKEIDVAFLPCNLPYTMDTKQCASAARAFKPAVLYPYHQGRSDPSEVKEALSDVKEIEVRVLSLP